MVEIFISTERLILRSWREEDLSPFAAMNSDLKVMEFFPSLLSREQSDELVGRIKVHLNKYGFGLFAIERRSDGAFLGFTGLNSAPAKTPVFGDIEIGWRLASQYWRQGYAHEAARACIEWFCQETCHTRLVSFTSDLNLPSQNLMRKLGFYHSPELDFEHPAIPQTNPLCQHRVFVQDRHD